MRATILPKAIILTRGPEVHGQYNGQWVYCGLSTDFVVFLIFTTRLYSCYNVIVFIN